MNQGYSMRVGVVVLLEDANNQIAMQLRDKKPGLMGAGQWVLFGGLCQQGETLSQAAVRIIRREMGVELDPVRLRYLGSHPLEVLDLVTHSFRYSVEGELDVVELTNRQDWRFLSSDDLHTVNVLAHHRDILRHYWGDDPDPEGWN